MINESNNRISFSKQDADHLYELCLQNFQDGCWSCEHLKGRIEKFLGEKRVRSTKNSVKKNPYDEQDMSKHNKD